MIFEAKRLHSHGVDEGSDNNLEDYSTYPMSLEEKILYSSIAAVAVFTVGLIFYHSIILSAIITPIALLYPKIKTRQIIEKRKSELNLQFRDMLYSVSSSLSAGKSIEMTFRDVIKDLEILYPDPETDILREVRCIITKIELNETVEAALSDFARRSHLEDISNFVDVFYTCKRTGGNIAEVIRNASNIINDKIEIKQEIITMLAERKLEQKVLNVLPILMVLLLSASAGDYISPVFSTIAGRMAMTASVILLAVSYFISKRIMDIRV